MTQQRNKARELRMQLNRMLFDNKLDKKYQVVSATAEGWCFNGDRPKKSEHQEVLLDVQEVEQAFLTEGFDPKQSLWKTAREVLRLSPTKLEALHSILPQGEVPTSALIATAMLDTVHQVMAKATIRVCMESLGDFIDEATNLITGKISEFGKKIAEREAPAPEQVHNVGEYLSHYFFGGIDLLPIDLTFEKIVEESEAQWLSRIAFALQNYYVILEQAYQTYLKAFRRGCKDPSFVFWDYNNE